MVSTNSFNVQFWLLTLALVFFWTIVLSTASSSTHSSQKQLLGNHEKASRNHELNCKNLCKQCGCMGFYCGEECICECNNDNSDTACLASMQSNAQKLNIPFQMLIQGPSNNRFVRNALQYSQDKYGIAVNGNLVTNRNKRSTVLVYRPSHWENSIANQGDKEESSQRKKRAVGQLDWFSDFANSLVRPAPLNSRKKSSQSLDSVEMRPQTPYKRAANKKDMDRSWFADSPSLLLRPAPLFKKQRNKVNNEDSDTDSHHTFSDNDDDSSYELPIRAVGKFPKVLKETLRSLQDTTIGSETANELGETLRSRIKESTNVLQSQVLGDNNLEFLPTSGATLRDNIQQTLSQFFPVKNDSGERLPPLPIIQRGTSPKMTGKNKFMWFRPVRFLQRVQQAIN